MEECGYELGSNGQPMIGLKCIVTLSLLRGWGAIPQGARAPPPGGSIGPRTGHRTWISAAAWARACPAMAAARARPTAQSRHQGRPSPHRSFTRGAQLLRNRRGTPFRATFKLSQEEVGPHLCINAQVVTPQFEIHSPLRDRRVTPLHAQEASESGHWTATPSSMLARVRSAMS
jgi:hypothetical protein